MYRAVKADGQYSGPCNWRSWKVYGIPRQTSATYNDKCMYREVINYLLGRELSRSQRESTSTIIRLGEHFKAVNDTHGHVVGDEVLSEIARRLLSCIRSYDFVGRHGGEEFLVV